MIQFEMVQVEQLSGTSNYKIDLKCFILQDAIILDRKRNISCFGVA